MVLGQCMETLRSNQRALARSLASQPSQSGADRVDTRDVRRALAVVPFRHSRLTEVLMDYFVGEGRVAIVVNVNPYDTGYDENSHVMRFAALAREVVTTAPTAVARALPSAPPPSQQQQRGKREGEGAPHRRKVTISVGGRSGRGVSEAHLEVLEGRCRPLFPLQVKQYFFNERVLCRRGRRTRRRRGRGRRRRADQPARQRAL